MARTHGGRDRIVDLLAQALGVAAQAQLAVDVPGGASGVGQPFQCVRYRAQVAQLTRDREVLGQQAQGGGGVALFVGQVGQAQQRARDAGAVVEVAPDGEALLEQKPRRRSVAERCREIAQVVQPHGDAAAIAVRALEREALLQQCACARALTDEAERGAQVVEHLGDGQWIPQLALELERLLHLGDAVGVVAALVGHDAQALQRGGNALAIAELALQRQALCVPACAGGGVALRVRQHAGSAQGAGTHRRGSAASRALQQRRQPAAAFVEQAAQVPERPDRAGQAQAAVAGVFVGGPGQRGAQVVVLGIDLCQALRLIGALHRRARRFGKCQEVREVARAVLLRLAAFVQPVACVVANRFQHPVARVRGVEADERLVDEGGQAIENTCAVPSPVGAHGLGSAERPAAGEDREPRQQRTFGRSEQVVAPVDQCTQRLLALRRTARAAAQEVEVVVQARCDGFDRQGADPRRSEFDRQCDAFQALADRHHR